MWERRKNLGKEIIKIRPIGKIPGTENLYEVTKRQNMEHVEAFQVMIEQKNYIVKVGQDTVNILTKWTNNL
jgi:hypothetical protein